MFGHLPLILLVNGRGYVERTYTGRSPGSERFVRDLRKLR